MVKKADFVASLTKHTCVFFEIDALPLMEKVRLGIA
jgi:hypothetical protein